MSAPARLLPLLLFAIFLVALAGALASFSGPQAYLPRLLFLGAAVSFASFLVRGRHEIAFLFVRARRVAEPGPSTTWLLAAAVGLVGAFVLERTPLRVDATSRGLNRLSEASRAILQGGDDPIEMIGIYRENSPLHARALDLLSLYRLEARRVQVEMVDPDRRPERIRELGIERVGFVLVRAPRGREEVTELSEPALTQAILRAENPRRFRLAFTTGHGERSITDQSPEGLGDLANLLREAGYEPVEARLYEEEIPGDVAALAIVGPRRSFLPAEIERIHRHLGAGGRVLACLEPGTVTGLESLLRTRGVALDSLEIFDESPATQNLGFGPRVVVVTDYADHPLVGPGPGFSVFAGARRVGLEEHAQWGIDAQTLFRTGPRARELPLGAEARAEGGREAPISLAIVQEWETPGSGQAMAGEPAPEKPYGRLCVVGDADWLSGRFVRLLDNATLALRTFHWLARREFLLRIPSLDMSGTPLRLTLSGVRTLFYLLQVILPAALVGVGVWIWNRRR